MENIVYVDVNKVAQTISKQYLLVFKKKSRRIPQGNLGLQKNCDVFCEHSRTDSSMLPVF